MEECFFLVAKNDINNDSQSIKLHVLYIITGLRYGGAEKLLYHTCKYLQAEYPIKIEIMYFDSYAPLSVLFSDLGIDTILIQKNVWLLPRIINFLLKRHFSLIHTHLIHADILGRLAAFLTTNRKTTAIFATAHGTEWFRWKKSIYCALVRLVDRWLALPKRSHIIAISQSVRDILVHGQGIPLDKINLLYNAIEIPEISLREHRHEFKPLRLLYIGRLAPEKNIPCLLRALESIKGLPLTLTIVGEGKMEENIRSLIEAMSLHEYVRLEGATLSPDNYYADHDIFVLPSSSEGLGIVILEAFSHGLPVIGSNVDGIKELLADNRGLLFKNDDHHHLANQIKLLYDRPELRRTLAKNGFYYVKRYHDIRDYAARLYQVYQESLAGLKQPENVHKKN